MIIPKNINTFCSGNACNQHQPHVVTQYKKGKPSDAAQGNRRYKRKQQGFGGQTKPIARNGAKVTRKIVVKLTCSKCHSIHQKLIDRANAFDIRKK